MNQGKHESQALLHNETVEVAKDDLIDSSDSSNEHDARIDLDTTESRSTLWRLEVTERDSAYPNLSSLSSVFPHEKASTTSLLSPGLSIYKRSR
ncbi:hypothetical protein LWI29_018630 [Acer saccharum]|uniref:Uncharacterized protein n=1 Tax=Acer saccharum TaxID=4024 RepID=A0AA39RXC6_ACESA|nr:hypothetical protein LWI29_018630 [Acer saccharum]